MKFLEIIKSIDRVLIDSFRAIYRVALFEGRFADLQEEEDIYNVVMVVTCVICAALASGLTIGLMAFDSTKLEIKAMTGTEKESLEAKSILPLIKRHHLLLVPNWVAIILSVSLVLLFGEIVPSSIFTGPRQLSAAASCTKLVKFLLFIFYPIAYPISRVLDYFFGSEEGSSSLSRKELEALLTIQNNASIDEADDKDPHHGSGKEHADEEELSGKEMGLLIGVLRLSKLCIRDVMISVKDVYGISADALLDKSLLEEILSRGFSRIPVFNRKDKQNIIGFLLVKNLIVVNPTHRRPVRSIGLREPLIVAPDGGLLEMLQMFESGRCHMALVSQQPDVARASLRKGSRPPQDAAFIGMVTLEDVLEKIIQEDIVDETDAVEPVLDVGFNPDSLTRRKCAMVGSMTGLIRTTRPNYDLTVDTDWDRILRRDDRDDDGNDEFRGRGVASAKSTPFRRPMSVGRKIPMTEQQRRSKSLGQLAHSLGRSFVDGQQRALVREQDRLLPDRVASSYHSTINSS